MTYQQYVAREENDICHGHPWQTTWLQ